MMTQCWPNSLPLKRGERAVLKDISPGTAVAYAAVFTAVGAIFVSIINILNDWRKDRRAESADKRKGQVAGAEAQLDHEDKFLASLLTRIETLERRDDERTEKIGTLQLDMENMRGQIKALVLRMEAAISGEPAQLVSELKSVLIGFRTLLDMAPVTKPVLAGTVERTHGEELTNPAFQTTAKRRSTDVEKAGGK